MEIFGWKYRAIWWMDLENRDGPSTEPCGITALKVGLGGNRYHIEISIKSVENYDKLWTFFYSLWINLTADHTAEIKAKVAGQCTLLISLHVLSICVNECQSFNLLDKLKHMRIALFSAPILNQWELGKCISMTEADVICTLMHCQWYDTLKIHMKQLRMRYDSPLLRCSAIWFQLDSTQCNGKKNVMPCNSLVQTDSHVNLYFIWLWGYASVSVVLWYVIFT